MTTLRKSPTGADTGESSIHADMACLRTIHFILRSSTTWKLAPLAGYRDLPSSLIETEYYYGPSW